MATVYYGKHTIFDQKNKRYLKSLIENEDEAKISNDEGRAPFSLRLKKYLLSSGLGDLKNVAVSFVSLLLVVFYATDTYTERDSIRTLIEIFLLLGL